MMMDGRYDEEDEEYEIPFQGAERTVTLQKCRVFNASPLDEEACVNALTEMLFLLSTGTQLSEAEATDLFFMSTKLLQSSHPKLRRLHYVLMKELSPKVEQSFIASNSLMNHIKSGNDTTKSNAIRTLYAVMDNTMYGSIDRTITECMNSPNPSVVTAALVTGLHISQVQPDLCKKWSTQLTEVMKGRSKAQYAAIALLHRIRKNDRISVNRLIQQVKSGEVRSPLAVCLIVKMCAELMREDFEGSKEVYQFVMSMLRHNSDLVVFEAARAMASLQCVGDREIAPVVMVLQLQLSGDRVQRFASVFLISRLATRYPAAVAPINAEVENLVSDSNRIIATLAITTLLKTGTENTMERLLLQLSSADMLDELDDEFKMVIMDAVRVLNTKFPAKYEAILSFLFAALRGEGGQTLKQSLVDVMMETAQLNPASGELVLAHLAAYIDDCPFPSIIKQVIAHLAEQVPRSANPQAFIRNLYNFATLESAAVRAVAVTALAKIACRLPAMRRSIYVLLRRVEGDTDDEVRDRAVFYTTLFRTRDEALVRQIVDDVAASTREHRGKQRAAASASAAPSALKANVDDLRAAAAAAASAEQSPSGAGGVRVSPAALQGREEMRHIRQLRELGVPIKSSDAVPLTDADNDYVVSVIKHVYAAHVVLQFKVKNVLEDIAFTNVTVVTDTEELEAEPLFAIPIESVTPGSTLYAYTVLRYDPGEFPSGSVEASFRFTVGEDGGAEEDYPLESFDVDIKDFIVPADLGGSAGFEERWATLEAEEMAGTYALRSMRNLTVAVHELADFFGMHVVDGVPERVTSVSHTLMMAGTLADEQRSLILVQAKVFVATDKSVALQLALRGGTGDLREYLANALLS